MTYSVLLKVVDCTNSDFIMKLGAHSANAPLTNATHVNPADDSIKLLLEKYKHNSSVGPMTMCGQ